MRIDMTRKKLRDFDNGELKHVISERNRSIEQWVARHDAMLRNVIDVMDKAADEFVRIAQRVESAAAKADPGAFREIASGLRRQAAQTRRIVDKARHENRRRLDAAPLLPT